MNDEPIKIDVSKIVPQGWRLVDCATEEWREGDRYLSRGDGWVNDQTGTYWLDFPRIRRIEPVGRWVECSVELSAYGYYTFVRPGMLQYPISVAPAAPNFGGYQFDGLDGWHTTPQFDERGVMRVPVAVRFWREGQQ